MSPDDPLINRSICSLEMHLLRPRRFGLLATVLLLWACGGGPVAIPVDQGSDDATVSSSDSESSRSEEVRILSPPLGPKPSVAADAKLVSSIRAFLQSGGREVPCGPYRLWTDVDDPFLLVELDHLASLLDAEYETRLGIGPQGPIRETVILFARLRDYQRWETSHAGSRRGYAGHAAASEGIAVLHADRPRDEVLATTLHEMTHLVNRRALGGPLPRWLSEGLADTLGDSASANGFLPLAGAVGIEGELGRVQSALTAGFALPTIAELVGRKASSFDRPGEDGRSYDYELSALLLRFLLADEDTAHRFQGFLQDLAAGGRWSPELLWRHLEVGPGELDRRFRVWLASL